MSVKELSLPPLWRLERKGSGQPVLHTGIGRPFSLEMSHLTPLKAHQPLRKAIGFKGRSLKVLDITAGWGRDARLMAYLGCEVTAVEKNELVFVFLDFLNKNPTADCNGTLKFILGNSLNYLKTLKEETRPDVIYMDPMFPPDKKSGSGKDFQILQQITLGEEESTVPLFEEALKKCRNRVVVKQWKRKKPFKGRLLCSFPGRAVRFDVFAASL